MNTDETEININNFTFGFCKEGWFFLIIFIISTMASLFFFLYDYPTLHHQFIGIGIFWSIISIASFGTIYSRTTKYPYLITYEQNALVIRQVFHKTRILNIFEINKIGLVSNLRNMPASPVYFKLSKGKNIYIAKGTSNLELLLHLIKEHNPNCIIDTQL